MHNWLVLGIGENGCKLADEFRGENRAATTVYINSSENLSFEDEDNSFKFLHLDKYKNKHVEIITEKLEKQISRFECFFDEFSIFKDILIVADVTERHNEVTAGEVIRSLGGTFDKKVILTAIKEKDADVDILRSELQDLYTKGCCYLLRNDDPYNIKIELEKISDNDEFKSKFKNIDDEFIDF